MSGNETRPCLETKPVGLCAMRSGLFPDTSNYTVINHDAPSRCGDEIAAIQMEAAAMTDNTEARRLLGVLSMAGCPMATRQLVETYDGGQLDALIRSSDDDLALQEVQNA